MKRKGKGSLFKKKWRRVRESPVLGNEAGKADARKAGGRVEWGSLE